MRTLCCLCASDLVDTPDPGKVVSLVHQIALGDLRVCIHPRNCDNVRMPGHSQEGPKTLDELPPSARG